MILVWPLLGALSLGLLSQDPGRVVFEGEWLSPEERVKRRIEREEEAARRFGLVIFRGRWVTAEEKETREKGIFPPSASDQPAPAAPKRSQLEAVAQAAGAPLQACETLHFTVAGTCAQPTLRQAGQRAEEVYAAFEKIVFGPSGAGRFSNVWNPAAGRAEVFLISQAASYSRVLSYLRGRPESEAAVVGGTKDVPELLRRMVHQLGHLLLRRSLSGPDPPPAWLDEGFACLLEERVLGADPSPCSREVRWDVPWRNFLAQSLVQGKGRRLRPLLELEAQALGPLELAQSMSLVEFLAKRGVLPRYGEELRHLDAVEKAWRAAAEAGL